MERFGVNIGRSELRRSPNSSNAVLGHHPVTFGFPSHLREGVPLWSPRRESGRDQVVTVFCVVSVADLARLRQIGCVSSSSSAIRPEIEVQDELFSARTLASGAGPRHRRVCGDAGRYPSIVGTIRLIGSNANNVFSNAASSIQ